MDDWHIGIRHNGDYALSVLEQVFPGAIVADPRVPDNYSVALYEPTGRSSRELHLLVKGSQQLIRSRSAKRVMRGLLAHLTNDLYPDDLSLAFVQMAALIKDGQAFFVPAEVNYQRDQAQPRFAKSGFQMLDLPYLTFDPVTNELVIPEPQIEYDRAALAALDEHMRLGSELPGVEPGCYPVGVWILAASEGNAGPVTTASAVASLLPFVTPPATDIGAAVSDLIAIVKNSTVTSVYYETVPEMVKQITAVSRI